MKHQSIIGKGHITDKGELKMFMGDLKQFFSEWKGSKVIATFEIIPGEQSEALKAYYYKYVVPTMRKAFWGAGTRMTNEDCDFYLRELSPVMRNEEHSEGRWRYDIVDIEDVSNAELIEHIEFIKQMAAEEYGVYIEDPNEIGRAIPETE